MKSHVALPVALIVAATLSSGCQTTPAVYELADKTSANAAVFQQHLTDLSAHSRELAEARATQIASMDAFNSTLDAFIKRELFMRQRSNTPDDWSKIDARIKDLTSLRDELQKIEATAAISEKQRRDEILATRAELDTYTSAMRAAANALSALATPATSAERVRFTAMFAADVTIEVRASLEKSDKASQAAKALIDKVKDELKTSEKKDDQQAASNTQKP